MATGFAKSTAQVRPKARRGGFGLISEAPGDRATYFGKAGALSWRISPIWCLRGCRSPFLPPGPRLIDRLARQPRLLS